MTGSSGSQQTTDSKSFAGTLKRFRLDAGLTQEELAERSNLSVRGISDLERGARTRPYHSTLERLADALQLESHERRLFLERGGKSETNVASRPIGAYLGANPEGLLVGRVEELRRLTDAVSDAKLGRGRIVFMSGEPGVGKTRLAQESATLARDGGFLVLTGRCHATERTVPFFPFLDVLQQANRAVPQLITGESPARWSRLALLFPEWPLTAPLQSLPSEHNQHRLIQTIDEFFNELAVVTPVAIILDDLQWADESSLRLLQYLARHSATIRVIIVGTYRDIDIPEAHPLRVAVTAMLREGVADRFELKCLDEEDTAQLVEAGVGPVEREVAQWVHRLTGGNAFYVVETTRELLDNGRQRRENSKWSLDDLLPVIVPATVREVIAQRVGSVSKETRAILERASILGEIFRFEDLHFIAEQAETSIEDALEEAAGAGLVRDEGNDVYTFNHALTHQGIYSNVQEHRRRRLHRLVASMLVHRNEGERAGQADEIAQHFLAGGAPKSAISWIIKAGDEAERLFAHSEAESHYLIALDLATEQTGPELIADIQAKRGAAFTAAGQYDEALRLLEPAMQTLFDGGNLSRAAETLGIVLWAHAFHGTASDGARTAQHFLSIFDESVPASLMASLNVQLATIYHFLGQYADQVRTADRARLLATQAESQTLLAEAEDVLGYGLCLLGRIGEGIAILQRALEIARSSGHQPALADISGHIAIASVTSGDFIVAREAAIEAIAVSEVLGDPVLTAAWKIVLGHCHYYTGDWSGARQCFEEARSTGRDVGDHNIEAFCLFALGRLEIREGNRLVASEMLEESARLGRQTRHIQAEREASLSLAEIDILDSRPGKAIARLEFLLDRPEMEEQDVTMMLPTVALAHLELGDDVLADIVITGALARARKQGHVLAQVEALRILGTLRQRQARFAESIDTFETGLNIARDLPDPYQTGRLLYGLGVVEGMIGDVDRARLRLTEALTIFTRLGARADAQRVKRSSGELIDEDGATA